MTEEQSIQKLKEVKIEDTLEWIDDLTYQLLLIRNDDLAKNDDIVKQFILKINKYAKGLKEYLEFSKLDLAPDDVEREKQFFRVTYNIKNAG